jgi:hypothetical protein
MLWDLNKPLRLSPVGPLLETPSIAKHPTLSRANQSVGPGFLRYAPLGSVDKPLAGELGTLSVEWF